MTHSVVDDVVVPMPLAPSGARCRCLAARRRSLHHDRLLEVETDPDAVLDLVELAVTWTELDYSGADVVPPDAWTDFAEQHRWHRPERVARLFALATDIALRGSAGPTGPDVVRLISAEDILRGEL